MRRCRLVREFPKVGAARRPSRKKEDGSQQAQQPDGPGRITNEGLILHRKFIESNKSAGWNAC